MLHEHTNEHRGIGQIAGFLVTAAVFTGLLLGALSVASADDGNAEIRASVDADANDFRVPVILDPEDGARKVPITTVQLDRTAPPVSRCQGEGLVDPANVGAFNASGLTVAGYCRDFAFFAGDGEPTPAIPVDRPANHRRFSTEFPADGKPVEPMAHYGMMVLTRYETIVGYRHLDAETIRFLEMNLWGEEREINVITS